MSDLLQYTIKKDGEYQKELIECIELKNKEIERLNNIINEFEKYCKEMAHIEENELIAMNDFEEVYIDVLDKIKELKGSDKE